MGTWQSAKAQTVQFFDDAVSLTVQQTGGNTQSVNYAGKARANDAPYNGYTKLGNTTTSTANPQLGTFDLVNTSQLTLTGGSLITRPLLDDDNNPYVVTGTRLQYRVYLKTATTIPAFTALPFPTSATVTSPAGAKRYSGTGSANLLSGLTVGGKYVIELRFEVSTSSDANGDNTDSDTQGVNPYQAEFDLTAPPAPTLKGTAVYVTPNSGSNANTQLTYTVNSSTPPPPPAFVGANLGGVTYDINTGQLTLNGGMAVTTEAGNSTVTNATLYYRVRQQGTGGGAFSFITLAQTANSNGSRTFTTTTNTVNLVNSTSVTGNYSIDIYYQASGTNGSSNFTLVDNNNNSYYTASFTVNGTPVPSTVWTGGLNDNWFQDGNWSNGIPGAGTNVTIRNFGSGTQNPYPRIFCNTTYVYTSSSGQQTTITNANSGLALARNVVMEGNSIADASKLGLVVGTLNVGGDFDNRYNSFSASDGTTTAFVGVNQTISGGTFSSVSISGGGIKSLQTSMNVTADLTFANGFLATDVTNPIVSIVTLADRAPINSNLGGRLLTETDNGYLRGLVTTTHRNITLNQEDTFGNIGMALTYSNNNPGEVTITRNTVQAYSPGSGAASGVRRIFDVTQPAASQSATLTATVRFTYLDSETKNLGPNGNINIDEDNLGLFVTTDKGNTFTNLGRTSLDTSTNNLTLNGVTSFSLPTTTFTLGDRTNPLPVELVAFDAKRSGANALITWVTASERNSAGFEVQVSTNGLTFAKLAFVASNSANSSVNQTYSYTDAEAGKSGVRYYRLRQVDLDGQYAFSPTRAVSFAAANGTIAALSAYPSPFTTTDQAALVVQAPTAGAAQLQLMDMMGRTLASRELTTVAGISEVPVPNASNLPAGSYLVKVTFATGEVKTLRIQKK
ncbi:MAG: T9SS type A sorting domain-containing protein [Hymenobacter sp.]|nr:MAG: T9SS type A sorting domain-containing protein [Hymenobacter sp.]